MPHLFPSPEWVAAYKEAINSNAAYKTAGKDWTHGVVAMCIKAEPALGLEQDVAMWLDVHQGQCRDCKLIPAADAQGAAFIVLADHERWKAVIRKELDPIKAMMQGKIKLTKGHMPTIVRYVQSTKELVESASRVETKFRDEP